MTLVGCGNWWLGIASAEIVARHYRHLCTGPELRTLISYPVDRNFTMLRIEHLHPALQLAHTAECSVRRGLVARRMPDMLGYFDCVALSAYPYLCLPGCINELTVSLLRQRHNCWDGS